MKSTSLHLRQSLKDICLIWAPFFALFLICRLALLLAHPEDFASLDLPQALAAMALGALHFDTSITLVFLGLPIWLHALSFTWVHSLAWRRIVYWYALILLLLFAFVAIADIVYFGFVHRHIGHELVSTLKTDPGLLFSVATGSYGWLLMLFALGIVLMLWLAARLQRRLIRPRKPLPPYPWAARLLVGVLSLGLIILGIRGSATSKPIKPVYAFENSSMEQGYLALNGPFCAFHALQGSGSIQAHFMADAEALKLVRTAYASAAETYPLDQYPLLRERRVHKTFSAPPNIVVLLLESWDALHVDISRELLGLKPYGVTPNFNTLAQQGLFLSNFLANGQRSIDAIESILTGMPPQPGQRYLGEGVEINRFAYLGQMARQAGYATLMLQGSRRGSFYLDKIAPLAGFDRYFGAQDFPASLHTGVAPPAWGGWDLDLMDLSNKLFAQSRKPFLGFVFTVSTHTPFDLPDRKWQRFKPDSEEHKLLNSMLYADWVLGRFFRQAKEAGYYDNTIFVLVGDHFSGIGKPASMQQQHHVPALILGPGIKPGIDSRLASQADLIPTLIDLAGWNTLHTSLGHSAVDPSSDPSVFLKRDNLVGLVRGKELIMHNLQRPVLRVGSESGMQRLEKELLATVQVAHQCLESNRLFPPSSVLESLKSRHLARAKQQPFSASDVP